MSRIILQSTNRKRREVRRKIVARPQNCEIYARKRVHKTSLWACRQFRCSFWLNTRMALLFENNLVDFISGSFWYLLSGLKASEYTAVFPSCSLTCPWSAEEMLDRKHQRLDIPARARTAHKDLQQKRPEDDLCWIVPPVPPTTSLVKRLSWTELNWVHSYVV